MSDKQLFFMAIVAAAALAVALINWWRLTEAKDEIALLEEKIKYNRRISDMRYKEFTGGYMSEYAEFAKIYEEEETE